jgi:hypothetical protein
MEDGYIHRSSVRLLISDEKIEFYILFVLLVFPWSTLPGLCVFSSSRLLFPWSQLEFVHRSVFWLPSPRENDLLVFFL